MNALFYDILISHAAMYPDMQPQDFCKLAFQNEFGCGHLIKEKDNEKKREFMNFDIVDVQGGEFQKTKKDDARGKIRNLKLCYLRCQTTFEIRQFQKSSSTSHY